MLVPAGYEVLEAPDGDSSLARALADSVDLVVLGARIEENEMRSLVGMMMAQGLSVALAGQLALTGCGPRMTAQMSPERRLRERVDHSVWRICDGAGYEVEWADKTHFAVYLETLEHPVQALRASAAGDAQTSTHRAATYPQLLDAFIDYGPVERLDGALLRAWTRAEDMSQERYEVADVYLQLKDRRYLWAHPEVGRRKGLKTNAEIRASVDKEFPDMAPAKRPPVKGWRGFASGRFAEELLAEGDKQYDEVWQEYQRLRPLCKEDKLKPINWDYPGERTKPGRTDVGKAAVRVFESRRTR